VQSQGEWAGRPLQLAPWQRTIVRDVFGWKRADGSRQFRTVYVEVPRKNGKSTLCSALALYLLVGDGEPGARVYSAAADRAQAELVFGEARAMVEQSPALARRVQAYRYALVEQRRRGSYKVLSAEAYTKHGLNASGIIFDELHAQPNRELYDVLRTSTGARRQPLMVMITTAGWDRTSLCWEQHERSRRTIAEPLVEPEHYGVIWAAEEGDDWREPATWAKANPNLGISLREEYLAGLAREAQSTPGMVNGFLRLHLDLWTASETRWLDMGLWDGCAETEAVELAGRECWAGLDLASTSDMAALALVFAPVEAGEPWRVRLRYWIPAANLQRRVEQTGTPYDVWARAGLVTPTPGNVIDYQAIRGAIAELGALYRIREVAYDPWGALQLVQELQDDGVTVVEFRQGFASMASPMREWGRMVALGELAHDGNPILRWNVDNVHAESDAAGNQKPSKRRSVGRIDGLVAGLMALERGLRAQGKRGSTDQGELVVLEAAD
jgi:phage terminase large subunit-like protein